MTDSPTRCSPINPWLSTRHPEWGSIADAPVAVRFRDIEAERAALRTLALCDFSALRKLGVKGPDAAAWLSEQGIEAPAEIHQSSRLADDGLIVRLGADEFFLESGVADETVSELANRLNSGAGRLFPVERQDATFLLSGSRSLGVLAQTCSIDFSERPPQRLVMTHVAGVACAILPESGDTQAFRCWVDPSYAVYLWETLVEICEELGGNVVGVGCVEGIDR